MVQVRARDTPPPPPEAPGAYRKKSGEICGVIAMIDSLIAELDKEMTEAETEEKLAQEENEQLMADSAEKRAADSKSLTDKGALKADSAHVSLRRFLDVFARFVNRNRACLLKFHGATFFVHKTCIAAAIYQGLPCRRVALDRNCSWSLP